MNNHDYRNSMYSQAATYNDLAYEPTDALTINTQRLFEAARSIDTRNHAPSQIYTDSRLLIEFDVHKLEEQIIIGRQLLATKEGDTAEIREYVTAASTTYTRHLNKMLELPHVNAKIKNFPVLPIAFSIQETSELYWTLVRFGSVESVVAQVECGLKENLSRLLEKMAHAQQGESNAILKAAKFVDAALRQWRPRAEAAVYERCITIQRMVSAEMQGVDRENDVVEVPDDGSSVDSEETYGSRYSSVRTL